MNFRTIPVSAVSKAIRILYTVTLLTVFAGAVTAQRAITNPSIEDPAFANNQFFFYSEGLVTGWLTSHPLITAGCTDGGGPSVDCRPIERWSSGFNSVSPSTGAGLRWVELNAYTNSMIYQSICMTNGESFGYSFVHRGRGSDTVPDVAQFRIGIPAALPAGSKAADSYDFPIATVATENDGGGAAPTSHPNATVAFADGGNGWRRYTGTFNYTGSSQIVNLGFVAISTGNGDLSFGNFIDDVQITLSPYLELSSSSTSGAEGSGGGSNTPANRPAIRIGGNVTTPVTVNLQVTGGSAVIGNDYSLTVPFQPGNTTSTASVTIPVGTYDGTSAASLFPIPFSISADLTQEPNETVSFSITSVSGGTIASPDTCGVAPEITLTYTILDDDAVTAGGVDISGRVLTADGRALRGAYVILTDSQGNARAAVSTSFGYYRFEDVAAGATYVLSVSSKRYQFDVRMMTVLDEIAGLDLIALE